jgi:hypothetical protein
MEVQMSQYDNFRDDDIVDQIDREHSLGRNGNFNNEGVGTGFGIAAIIALAVIVLVAWNTGYMEIKPYEGSTHVTGLPASPPLVPALPPTQPQG